MSKPLPLLVLLLALAAFPAPGNAADASPLAPSSTLSFFPLTTPESYPGSIFRLIPIASNHALGGAHPGLTRVIIGIHDSSRNAQGTVALLSTLAGPDNDKILILAPQFLAPEDPQRFYPDILKTLRDSFILWPVNSWEDGNVSRAEAPEIGVSSFMALDIILAYLNQKQIFPDLKVIVIAGHGAGADFAHRYAAMSPTADAMEKQGMAIRFLVANASSYLYLTPARPKVNSFGFATPAVANCTSYNHYRYGLEDLNTYGRQTGVNAIKTGYSGRHVAYLIGENAGMADPFPDGSCEAGFEGPNRTIRGIGYGLYLNGLYGDAIKGKQITIVVPKTGYDPVAMFGSPCGLSVLFGDGTSNCAVPPPSRNDLP